MAKREPQLDTTYLTTRSAGETGGAILDPEAAARTASPSKVEDPAPRPSHHELDVAVPLPCRNEEPAIGSVVERFRRALPNATVYVYDNASSDRTAEVARAAGAIVRHVPRPDRK